MYRIYQIASGDTIESIAAKTNTTPEILSALNGLNPSSKLIVGAYIIVPNEDNLFDKYVVMKGDNMYTIARNNDVNPNELIKLNGLNPNDLIYPGDEILIPKPTTGFYITEKGDTLNKVTSALNIPANEISNQNNTIYLLEDQLIVYKK